MTILEEWSTKFKRNKENLQKSFNNSQEKVILMKKSYFS